MSVNKKMINILRSKTYSDFDKPLVNKTSKVFQIQTPNEFAIDSVNGDHAKLYKPSKGFEVSTETSKMIWSMNSYEMGLEVLKFSKSCGLQTYSTMQHSTTLRISENEGEVEDSQNNASYTNLEFQTMRHSIEKLSRQPGTVARDARNKLIQMYRQGWGDAVHPKYLTETKAQTERRINGVGTTINWNSMTNIVNAFDADDDIKLQLSIPELRWQRANDVQREAALSQLRWVFHLLSWCAHEARLANQGVEWDLPGPIKISSDVQQYWDDAVSVMKTYMKMATRFVDANERPLQIKAVIWELYYNKFHCKPVEYLKKVAKDSDSSDAMLEFLRLFNTAETKQIRLNAKNAWAKARVFFLFKGSITGLNVKNNIFSSNALFNFLDWWRNFAAFAKVIRNTTSEFETESVPEDMRDFQAARYLKNDSKKWCDLTEQERNIVNAAWTRGVLQCRMNTRKDNALREQQERYASTTSVICANNKRMRIDCAFPKPDEMDNIAEQEFQKFNPDFKKQEEQKKRLRSRRQDEVKKDLLKKQKIPPYRAVALWKNRQESGVPKHNWYDTSSDSECE